jgi:hypothetical protein
MHGDPDVVKGQVVPRIAGVTPELLREYLTIMAEVGLVTYYAADDDLWLEFRAFEGSQPNLRKDREAKSTIPSPNSGVILGTVATPEQCRSNSGVMPESLPHKLREEKFKLREGPAETAGRVSKPRKAAQPKSERPGWGDLIAQYSDSWKALHSSDGRPPVIEGSDISALARVYDSVGLDETKTLIQRFVSESDPHIARRGHILRDLPSRQNAYRAKPVSTGADSKRNFKEASKHVEETRDRTHEL